MRLSLCVLLLCIALSGGQSMGWASEPKATTVNPLDYEEDIKRIFEGLSSKPTRTTDKTTNKKGNGSGEETKIKIDEFFNNKTKVDNATSAATCALDDGREGVCVQYYQCNTDTQTVIDDGFTLIDFRQRSCPHYLETCCLLKEVSYEKPQPVELDAPSCGWSNPGAHDLRVDSTLGFADFAEFPWMVALIRKTSRGEVWEQSDFLGGGSLIHPSVVLTSAHKVDGKTADQIKCRAGEWDTQTTFEIYPHQERDVSKIITHEDFFRKALYNSISLLVMARPFVLEPHIAPVCLSPRPPPPETACASMGWGKKFNDNNKYAVLLKKVELPSKSREECTRMLRTTTLGRYYMLPPSLTCAGGGAGQDTCEGDGGSAFVCPISPTDGPKRYAVYGMVAGGLGCGQEGVPGVYVDVPHLYRWVGEKMSQEGFGTTSYSFT